MGENTGNQKPEEFLPLDSIKRLTRRQIEDLQTHWITTLGEFVGASATPEGRDGLQNALGLAGESFEKLLADIRDILGETRFRELSTPRPGGPLGALIPTRGDKEGRRSEKKENKGQTI